MLADADAEGLPCYLESSNPRNVSLYLRHGFVETGQLPLPDGPSLIQMWREPMRLIRLSDAGGAPLRWSAHGFDLAG